MSKNLRKHTVECKELALSVKNASTWVRGSQGSQASFLSYVLNENGDFESSFKENMEKDLVDRST